jgi:ATP-dependent Clp protease ATP-binding subunit ClpB
MWRLDKLTIKTQEAFQEAQEVADRHDRHQIGPLHLPAALIAQTDGVLHPLLTRLGMPP